jgi:hypothetical protein
MSVIPAFAGMGITATWSDYMSSESNWAGQQGATNPYKTQQDFKAGGMNDSQASEAAAAAARARSAQGKN